MNAKCGFEKKLSKFMPRDLSHPAPHIVAINEIIDYGLGTICNSVRLLRKKYFFDFHTSETTPFSCPMTLPISHVGTDIL